MPNNVKVILLQDIDGLGKAGELKDVAPGYARNFLLPRKAAKEATPANVQQLKDQAAALTKKREKERAAQVSLAERLSQQQLVFKVKVGEQQRLYGSVTSKDIAESLEKATGVAIDRRWVHLDDPIRTLGSVEVPLRIASDIHATVTVNVVSEA